MIPETTGRTPPAVTLIDRYYHCRRNVVRLREELATASDDFLAADRALREHIEREGEAGDALSIYSLNPDGSLRWKQRPHMPFDLRNYMTPLHPTGRTRDGGER